jgi:hypothetical protein
MVSKSIFASSQALWEFLSTLKSTVSSGFPGNPALVYIKSEDH